MRARQRAAVNRTCPTDLPGQRHHITLGIGIVPADDHVLLERQVALPQLSRAEVLEGADDEQAKRDAVGLTEQIPGLRAVDAGTRASARVVEAITVLLIGINKRYKTLTGVQIVGLR